MLYLFDISLIGGRGSTTLEDSLDFIIVFMVY